MTDHDGADDAGRRVVQLLAAVPTGDPPTGVVLARAQAAAGRRRRRRGAAAVVGVAALVAAAAVGPEAVVARSGPGDSTAVAGHDDAVPSRDTRLVGAGGFSIAVPAAWTTRRLGPCGAAGSATTFEDYSSARYNCVSLLTSGVLVSTGMPRGSGPIPRDAVDHLVCRGGLCSATVVAGSAVTFHVTVDGPPADAQPLLEEIVGSLAPLPKGWTAVPDRPLVDVNRRGSDPRLEVQAAADYLRRLGEAGLVGRLADRPVTDVRDLGVDPAPGSVVPVGTTVVVDRD